MSAERISQKNTKKVPLSTKFGLVGGALFIGSSAALGFSSYHLSQENTHQLAQNRLKIAQRTDISQTEKDQLLKKIPHNTDDAEIITAIFSMIGLESAAVLLATKFALETKESESKRKAK